MPDEPSLAQKAISYSCAVLGGAIVGGLGGVWLYMGLATNGGGRHVPRHERAEVAEWARHDRSAPKTVVFGGAIVGAVLAGGALYGADPVRRRS